MSKLSLDQFYFIDFLNISRNSAYQSFGGNEISITNESYHENVEKCNEICINSTHFSLSKIF